MRRISFYKNNKSDDLLHIETEGCIVNIRVNLHNTAGKEVTSISIKPDVGTEENWMLAGTLNNRVIKGGTLDDDPTSPERVIADLKNVIHAASLKLQALGETEFATRLCEKVKNNS